MNSPHYRQFVRPIAALKTFGLQIAPGQRMPRGFSSWKSSGSIKNAVQDLNVKLIDESVLIETLRWVSGCERCAVNAVIGFDYLLDALTGADPTTTEYIMCRPIRCPKCSGPITEKTHVSIC